MIKIDNCYIDERKVSYISKLKVPLFEEEKKYDQFDVIINGIMLTFNCLKDLKEYDKLICFVLNKQGLKDESI